MIHAYLFIAGGIHVRGDDPTGHGQGFQRLAAAINEHGGYEITTTHTFHAEVQSYQTHVWQCSGSCKSLPPFFGIVRRAMNRPPGPSDSWYQEHQERCNGGTWVKIAEPPPKKKKGTQKNKIDQWLKTGVADGEGSSSLSDSSRQKGKKKEPQMEGCSALDDAERASRDGEREERATFNGDAPLTKRPRSPREEDDSRTVKRPREEEDSRVVKRPKGMVEIAEPGIKMVECPVCPAHVPEADINSHLDTVHDF